MRSRLIRYLAALLGSVAAILFTLKTTATRAPSPPSRIASETERQHGMHEIRVRRSAEIVMLGDSLTAYPNWTELTGWRSVANRGLSGDTTADVLARIQDVNDLSPKLVFLLVGVNDAALGVKVEQSAKNILEIVARLKTKVYIIRPFPTNDARTNATLGSLYAETRSLVGDSAHYIDINKRLGGETILPQFTTDGVHLSPSGYAVWRDAMLEIAEDDD